MEKNKKYERRRDGLAIAVDTVGIISECNQITFINNGDWPFYITVGETNVQSYLDRGMEKAYGSEDKPEIFEKTIFKVTFDAVNVGTVKSCSVERVNIIELPDDCVKP